MRRARRQRAAPTQITRPGAGALQPQPVERSGDVNAAVSRVKAALPLTACGAAHVKSKLRAPWPNQQ